MPGYCVDRFPNLSAEDREEYTCSICQDIFNTPVTTSCRHTFCEDCITEWLESNTTCPNDRKRLSPRKLSPASLQHMSAPVMLINKMNADMRDKTVAIIRKMLAKHNTVSDVCKHAVDCMDLEFGTDWQCLAEWCAGTQRYLNPKKGFYLRVKFTPITFTMYHSKRARLERNKIVRQLDNIETDMKASMVSVVTGIVLDAIDRSSSIRKTARNIEARMESRYEGTKWVCFLYDHGGYRINRY
ncbi:unnamed protein product, partial [Medioppia subpectinata]